METQPHNRTPHPKQGRGKRILLQLLAVVLVAALCTIAVPLLANAAQGQQQVPNAGAQSTQVEAAGVISQTPPKTASRSMWRQARHQSQQHTLQQQRRLPRHRHRHRYQHRQSQSQSQSQSLEQPPCWWRLLMTEPGYSLMRSVLLPPPRCQRSQNSPICSATTCKACSSQPQPMSSRSQPSAVSSESVASSTTNLRPVCARTPPIAKRLVTCVSRRYNG